MKKNIEGILYDWHNSIKLRNQNKDIDFFKKLIGIKKKKKILIIGAGTGRVAIPLSYYHDIYALDKSKDRLEVLSKKEYGNLKIICNDAINYKSEEKFDYIIFPYSTMQNIYPQLKQKMILQNLKKNLKENGQIIIDNSDQFKDFENQDERIICEGYSDILKTNIIQSEKIRVHKEYVKLFLKFKDDKGNLIYKENERWNIQDEEKFDKMVMKLGYIINEKIRGYDKNTIHRTIYVLNKGENYHE